MKQSFYYSALVIFALASCSRVKEEPYDMNEPGQVTLGASMEIPTEYGQTKASVDNAGVFSWSAGDAIKVWTGKRFRTSDELTAGGSSAQFNFTLPAGESLQTVAVFPSTVTPDLDGNKLTLTLPSVIDWKDGEANSVMVATSDFSTKALSFKHVGGFITLTLQNVPAGAEKVVVTTGMRITGEFVIPDITAETLQIETTEDSSEGVTFTFKELESNKDEMVFYVPVPVGTYPKIGFDVQDGEGNHLWKYSASVTNSVARKKILKMPALISASAGGGIEPSTASVTFTLPENYAGVVKLPKTSDAVSIDVNPTASTLTLGYADDATAEEKPSTLNINVLSGTVEGLDINLPASTVSISGVASDATVNNVTAVTKSSTLIIDSGITVGTATVKQGGAAISDGTVTKLVIAEGATANGTSGAVKVDILEGGKVENIEAKAPATITIEKPSTGTSTVNLNVSSAAAASALTVGENVTVKLSGSTSLMNIQRVPTTDENSRAGVVVYVQEDPSQIGSSYIVYSKEDLADAILLLSDEDVEGITIQIGADFTYLKQQVVPAGKELLMNLNGKKLTYAPAAEAAKEAFMVEGKLLVCGAAAGSTLAVNETDGTAIKLVSDGEVEMTSGSITGFQAVCLTGEGAPKFTLSDGSLVTKDACISSAENGAGNGIVTITGGTIQSTAGSCIVSSGSTRYQLNGGTFTSANQNIVASGEAADNVFVNGGSFDNMAWDGSLLLPLSGSEGNYTVYVPAQLARLAKEVNEGNNAYTGATVALGNDLNLNNEVWTPMGTEEHPFNGTINGNDKVISNLTSDSGLFGVLSSATVNKVKIKDFTISGQKAVGAVAAKAISSTISSCEIANGTVESKLSEGHTTFDELWGEGSQAGAVVGLASNSFTAQNNNIHDVTVTGYYGLGGIAGRIDAETVNVTGNTVNNCQITQNTSAGADYSKPSINDDRTKIYSTIGYFDADRKVNSENNNFTSSTVKYFDGTVMTSSSWDNHSSSSMTELDSDHFLIFSAAQLKGFEESVNGGNHYDGKTVQLLNDIDWSFYTWIPIDDFYGNFDGGGHFVNNMISTNEEVNSHGVGFFGSITYTDSNHSAVIENLNMRNALFSAHAGVGGIVGEISSDNNSNSTFKIKNCRVYNSLVSALPQRDKKEGGFPYLGEADIVLMFDIGGPCCPNCGGDVVPYDPYNDPYYDPNYYPYNNPDYYMNFYCCSNCNMQLSYEMLGTRYFSRDYRYTVYSRGFGSMILDGNEMQPVDYYQGMYPHLYQDSNMNYFYFLTGDMYDVIAKKAYSFYNEYDSNIRELVLGLKDPEENLYVFDSLVDACKHGGLYCVEKGDVIYPYAMVPKSDIDNNYFYIDEYTEYFNKFILGNGVGSVLGSIQNVGLTIEESHVDNINVLGGYQIGGLVGKLNTSSNISNNSLLNTNIVRLDSNSYFWEILEGVRSSYSELDRGLYDQINQWTYSLENLMMGYYGPYYYPPVYDYSSDGSLKINYYYDTIGSLVGYGTNVTESNNTINVEGVTDKIGHVTE